MTNEPIINEKDDEKPIDESILGPDYKPSGELLGGAVIDYWKEEPNNIIPDYDPLNGDYWKEEPKNIIPDNDPLNGPIPNFSPGAPLSISAVEEFPVVLSDIEQPLTSASTPEEINKRFSILVERDMKIRDEKLIKNNKKKKKEKHQRYIKSLGKKNANARRDKRRKAE